MKRLFRYIATLSIILSLTSCVDDTFVDMPNRPLNPENGIRISGAVVPFDNKVVTTRADGDQPDDLFISGMTMFVFDSEGNLLQGYSDFPSSSGGTLVSSAVTIYKSNPTFVIDKTTYASDNVGFISTLEKGSDIIYFRCGPGSKLDACEIYIVANLWYDFETNRVAIENKEQLLEYVFSTNNTLAMPTNPETEDWLGFPMIGTLAPDEAGNPTKFDLTAGSQNNNAVATIPMKKLYSKIDFRLSVKANQILENGDAPKFQIEKVEVFNVPTLTHLGSPDDLKKLCVEKGKDEAAEYGDLLDYSKNKLITAKGVDLYQFLDPSINEGMTNTNGSFEITTFNRRTTQHDVSNNPPYIEFGFYMPEHYVKPYRETINLPNETMTEAEKDAFRQQMKPYHMRNYSGSDGERTYEEKKQATFIRLHGKYTDHHGQIYTVAYDVYLGQNNSDDFNVNRNYHLTNYLTITGITNHNQAGQGTISLDHRVGVTKSGYIIAQEREALIDAHFEVRPVDITMSANSTMTITIPAGVKKWISMEPDYEAANRNEFLYCVDSENKRIRRYFTTGLIEELNGLLPGGDGDNQPETYTITNSNSKSETYRIWFYIDENPNVYDGSGRPKQNDEPAGYDVTNLQFRQGTVNFAYSDPDVTGSSDIVFQQHNLWRVWNEGRFYDIEIEEEYLNNYAADDKYGKLHDGMAWGLPNVQLSVRDKAYYIRTQISDANGWINNLINDKFSHMKYDFYISDDECPQGLNTFYPYSGKKFTSEIINTAKITPVTLAENSNSAIQYVISKNKVTTDGNNQNPVPQTNWYLPSIDEIEDIVIGGYSYFEVFQDKFYWSSQPAYEKAEMRYDKGGLINNSGYADFYYDNKEYARATKVGYVNGVPQYVSSGQANAEIRYLFYREYIWNEVTDRGTEPTGLDPERGDGYQHRSTPNRIRAVYRSSKNLGL